MVDCLYLSESPQAFSTEHLAVQKAIRSVTAPLDFRIGTLFLDRFFAPVFVSLISQSKDESLPAKRIFFQQTFKCARYICSLWLLGQTHAARATASRFQHAVKCQNFSQKKNGCSGLKTVEQLFRAKYTRGISALFFRWWPLPSESRTPVCAQDADLHSFRHCLHPSARYPSLASTSSK